jgi:tyrosyl-tRNA synthetase
MIAPVHAPALAQGACAAASAGFSGGAARYRRAGRSDHAMTFKSEFLSVLEERGFIHQGTDLQGLDRRLSSGIVSGYIGFDATAPSLHAGSLLQIMLLSWLQATGHRPIVLMGGGTTKVGDPSGKDQQRALLTDAEIARNIGSIKHVFERFLTFGSSPQDAVMVDNDEWLARLGYVEFLREYGTEFTINRMLTFDSVRLRLERETPLTFLEFNYMLMQAYDFLELHRRYGCALQMGGSDQWGNIVNGVDLCRRKDGVEVFGLTTPLLTSASGKKMGKTESGAVWLNADLLSPYEYWQYWRNAEDADVAVMLARFTRLPMAEVRRLAALGGAEINEAKKILATEATALLHGRKAAEDAAETARHVFAKGGTGKVEIHGLKALASVTIARSTLEKGFPWMQAFTSTKLVVSNSEARRLLKQRGLRINNVLLTEERTLTLDDVREGEIRVSVGPKKHAVLKVV